MAHKTNKYYLPSPSSWPLKGSIGLICTVVGGANWLHEIWFGVLFIILGLLDANLYDLWMVWDRPS